MCHKWGAQKDISTEDGLHELQAIKRAFQLDRKFPFLALGVFIGEQLVGFTITEIRKEYGTIHFEKANESFVGVYAYLMEETASMLETRKVTLINFEQDLGIAGLRAAKRAFAPIGFLKKYRLRLA